VSYKKLFIFPRRWRICIHFSQRRNKWEKIWTATPSVCLKWERQKGARADSRSDSMGTDMPHFFLSSSSLGFFLSSARYNIISYTQEKNFGMIENSLDLTERRGRPWLEMRKNFFFSKKEMIWKRRWGNLIVRLIDALSSNLNRKGSNALHALYWCWGWTGCSNGKRCKWKRFWTVKINACFYCLNNLKIKRNIKIKLPTPFPSP